MGEQHPKTLQERINYGCFNNESKNIFRYKRNSKKNKNTTKTRIFKKQIFSKKCNGTYLTKEGHDLLKRVVEIVNQYNYNHSDAMTDYYIVNFSFDLELGKWDKPMIEPN